MNYLRVSKPCVSSVGEGSTPFWGFAASPLPEASMSWQASPDNGGLTTNRGKTAVGELSGDGGLLLTSLKVDRVSMAMGCMDEGGAVSSGLGWTLDGLTDDKINSESENANHWANIQTVEIMGTLREAILHLKSGKKLPVASLLCRLKMGLGGRRSGGSWTLSSRRTRPRTFKH